MTLYRQEFALCPWCNDQSGQRVDHLYDAPLPCKGGPWSCEECGHSFNVLVKAPGDVEITKFEDSKTSRSMVLLKFEGKDRPVFFVMDHGRYHTNKPQTDEEWQDSTRYFFEEHSCPTNWLRQCVAVIEDGDTDPHGFLTFVRAVDVPMDFNEHDNEQFAMIFPEAFPGQVIEGELANHRLISN